MRLLIICATLLFAFQISVVAQRHQKPRAVIFDSDMGPDYDDVGAIALLHAFADSGYIKILATVASTNYEGVAGVFNVFNTYFKRSSIPIGVPKMHGVNLKDSQHWSDSVLTNYPHAIKHNAEVPEAVELYRKILAAQPDASVTIITTGFFTNVAALLKSAPDKYSRLSGVALVTKKVKQLVSMAGRFPSGKEFNIHIDSSASQHVFANWPTPILLSGFEIGWKIRTGLPIIANKAIQKSPVKDVFRISIPLSKEDKDGRPSWDETAVLIAVKGFAPYYTLQHGTMIINTDGSNSWSNTGNKHAYLVEKIPSKEVEGIINHLMQHQPR